MLSVAIFILFFAKAQVDASQLPTWTTLDMPGAMDTAPLGISGDNIIGIYYDTSIGGRAFLYNGTTWTMLDMPGAISTSISGISGNNIVGYYLDASSVTHGFFYTMPSNNPPDFSFPDESTVTGNVRFLQKIPENFKFTEGSKDITKGSEYIKYLQIVLSEEGPDIYPESKVSGVYGDLTKNAVNNFIKTNNFEGESSVLLGKRTVEKLNADLEKFRNAIVMWRSRDKWIEKTVNKEYETYSGTPFGSSFPTSLIETLSPEGSMATAVITGDVLHHGKHIFFKGEDIIQIVGDR